MYSGPEIHGFLPNRISVRYFSDFSTDTEFRHGEGRVSGFWRFPGKYLGKFTGVFRRIKRAGHLGGQKKEPILIFDFPPYKLKEIPGPRTKRHYQRGARRYRGTEGEGDAQRMLVLSHPCRTKCGT